MKALLPVVVVLGICVLFVYCSDNPVDNGNNPPPPDTGKANQIATEAFQAIGDTIQALDGRDPSSLRNVRFDDIRSRLEKALTYQSDNGIAHLGLSMVELLELNYSSDIWAVVDSLDNWGGQAPLPFQLAPRTGRNVLIGRQFELMTELPVAASMGLATSFPSNMSIAHVQDIITNTVLPALNRSIGHLDVVEAKTHTELHMHVKDNGVDENIVVDLGEILVFSASVRALRSGFGTFTAYDVDLFGHDGSYNWLDEVRRLREWDYCSYAWDVSVYPIDSTHTNLYFHKDVDREAAWEDSLWLDITHYNLEDRAGALKLRNGGSVLNTAHADLLATLDRLDRAATFIRERTHETEENVIKLTDLTDLDGDLGDPSGPNFAKNWTRVEDVTAFARSMLNGPVQFTEELGPNSTSFSWMADLSRFFKSPVNDWRTLLPYHQWNLPIYIQRTEDVNSFPYDPQFGYYEFVRDGQSCTEIFFPHVSLIEYRATHFDVHSGEVFKWLDGPNGSPIDLDVARFPYCPDYTFNGVFPDMNRARWVELMDILDEPDIPPPDSLSVYARRSGGIAR